MLQKFALNITSLYDMDFFPKFDHKYLQFEILNEKLEGQEAQNLPGSDSPPYRSPCRSVKTLIYEVQCQRFLCLHLIKIENNFLPRMF